MRKMNFIALDFETAHANYPCEIGLSRVENGIITETKSWLIKPACFPYMNPWNERVHGISNYDVANEKNFEEHWAQLRDWLEDSVIVAHNAAFDIKVLRSALAHYDIALPHSEYFCSVSLSRKVWKQLPSHSLATLSQFHNIRFNHHRAGDDAKACAIITLKAFEEIGAGSVLDGLKKVGITLKKI